MNRPHKVPPRPEPKPLYTGERAGDSTAWIIALLPFIVIVLIKLLIR
jgi:hypothetical protein